MVEGETTTRWAAYHAERVRMGGHYLPTPSEVDARAATVRKFRRAGVPRLLVAVALYHGSPTPECVLRMVARHGPAEAWRRLEPFCDPVPEAY